MDGFVALFGQNNLTFHHFNQITVLKIVRVQLPPSYMSRLLALISHTLSTTSSFAYTSWPTGSFDWFVLGSGSLFFFILTSPLLPPLKNLKQSTVSVTNFYRHYKTTFWDKCARSRLWWQWKKDSAHVTAKAGGSGWIPTMSTASQHEVSQMSPSHWPLHQMWTFVKLTETGIFLWPSRECDIC